MPANTRHVLRVLCKQFVFWAKQDSCKPSVLAHPLSLPVLSYINRDYTLFSEKERSDFIPFREIHNLAVDRSRKLGGGAFGAVYLMKLEVTNQPVAVKILKYEDPVMVANEITMLGLLQHPHIVELFGVSLDRAAQECHLVMELATSDILGSLTDSSSLDEKLSLCIDATSGLEYLARHRIVHRDIKAPNVLVFRKETRMIAKLADFGFATPHTLSFKESAGTNCYLAPELRPPAHTLYMPPRTIPTLESDIFAFGCVLYEVLAVQQLPTLLSETAEQLSHIQALQRGLTRLHQQAPKLPQGLIQLIRQCWSQDPQQRPTALQLRVDLQSIRG